MDSEGIILESIEDFLKLKVDKHTISLRFLRFIEWFLSNGKSDKAHNTTVSFNNCMLRIPGSINSKNGAQVRIVRQWNSHRASIKPVLEDFYVYLADQRLKELRSTIGNRSKYRQKGQDQNISWIEILLQTPIRDRRKYAIWRILSPYLINVKKLQDKLAFNIIKKWLQRCNELERLDFYIDHRIREGISSAIRTGFFPISLEKLKYEDNELYHYIFSNSD
jgi:hypothetical protein